MKSADSKLFGETVVDGCLLLVYPHPSGISHFWNQPDNITHAATTLRSALHRSGLVVGADAGEESTGAPVVESELVVPFLGQYDEEEEEEEGEEEEEFTQRAPS
jgi:hypothetical protein